MPSTKTGRKLGESTMECTTCSARCRLVSAIRRRYQSAPATCSKSIHSMVIERMRSWKFDTAALFWVIDSAPDARVRQR
ncbi:hypothetical protein D9M71_809370 [compost metagenome]